MPYDAEQRETLPNDITETDFSNYIATINQSISPFDLEFRSTYSQHDKTKVFALVNTTSDAITQLATIHSPDEIAFVKRVLDYIFTDACTTRAEVYAISGMDATNLHRVDTRTRRNTVDAHQTTLIESDDEAPGGQDHTQQQRVGQVQSITASQADHVMQNMVDEGWFEVSQRRYYTLAPRALMELRGWLIETYNGDDDGEDDDDGGHGQAVGCVKFCNACRDIVTIGQRCPDLKCLARLHNHCTSTMWRSQGGRERCPVCKKNWEGFHYVGERALRQQNGQRSSAGGRRGASGQTNGPADRGVEEHDDDDDDDEG